MSIGMTVLSARLGVRHKHLIRLREKTALPAPMMRDLHVHGWSVRPNETRARPRSALGATNAFRELHETWIVL
jgi:hypothetical protein